MKPTTPTPTMSQKLKIKKIKCRICLQSFKIKSTDFDKTIQECLLQGCDLRSPETTELIARAVAQIKVIPIKHVAAQDCIEVTIEDPIVIKVDEYGIEIRTLS